jgi:hypothetical protein
VFRRVLFRSLSAPPTAPSWSTSLYYPLPSFLCPLRRSLATCALNPPSCPSHLGPKVFSTLGAGGQGFDRAGFDIKAFQIVGAMDSFFESAHSLSVPDLRETRVNGLESADGWDGG